MRSLLLIALAGGVLHGALFIASFPPWSLWGAAMLSLAPLALVAISLARSNTTRAGRGLALGVVFVAVLPSWLWIQRWTAEVSDAGWPVLAAYMSLWPTAWVGLTARLWRTFRSREPRGAWTALAAISLGAIAWGGIESLRAIVLFDGYPWYLLAHPLIDATWLSQSAALWGVAPLSTLCAASGVSVALVIDAFGRRHAQRGALRPRLVAVGVVALAWALLAAGGAIRLASLPVDDGPLVVVVQTDHPVNNKIVPTIKERDAEFASALRLSHEGVQEALRRGERADLVVWPETMVPGFGLERDTILLQRHRGLWPGSRYLDALVELHARSGAPLLVGASAFEGLRDEGNQWRWHRHYNSTYLVRGEPPFRRYDKIQLTPFGETMPYIRASKALESALLSLGARGFTFTLDEGTEEVVFELDGGARFVTPICFEDTLPPLCRRLVMEGERKVAHLLVNVSNDGWFGRDDAGRAAHLQAARWRTIELRVGLVRSANTGISAVVDPAGRVLASLPARQAGWLLARPVVSPAVTVYARFGEVGSWLLMAATLILFCGSLLRCRRSSAKRAPGAVVRGAAAATVLALLPTGVPGCAAPPSGRPLPTATNPNPASPSPDSPEVAMGLAGPLSRQPWSTKEQSIQPDQERAGDATVGVAPVPPAIPVVSSGSLRQTAIDLLAAASRSSYPLHVANAIEALEADPGALAKVVRPALVHQNRGVRFVALMAIGRTKLPGMETLVQPLLLDESESVRAAAIYAMARLGAPVDMNPLASMLRSGDPEVRGNAILVLGELKNPSAVPLLRSTIGAPMPRVDPARRKITDLQMAEALAKLGEDGELEPLRAALFSPPEGAELIALACQALGRLKDGGSVAALRIVAYSGGSAARPVEIRLLAMTALGMISSGDQSAAIEFGRRHLTDPNPQVRSLAVKQLAVCAGSSALPLLEARLHDSNAMVQIAAAESILRLTR